MKREWGLPVCLVALVLFGPGARAAEEQPKRAEPVEATVEKIMDQAVKNIGRRYNLNEAQLQRTDEIMKREVRRFLRENEKDVWPLIRELLASQLSGKAPESKDDAMRIGKAARPLAQLAEKAIFDANQEWRNILTEDQKKVHDYDLAEMRGTFQKIHQNFESWEKGTPSDAPLIPPPEAAGPQPPRPRLPAPGLPDPVIQQMELGVFEAIVDRYIKDYALDPAQIDTARSLLAEYKAKARDFQLSNRDQLLEISAKLQAAEKNKDRQALVEAEAARTKALEPFHGLVAEMEERVRSLLTSAQIEAHERRVEAGAAGKSAGVRRRPVPASGTSVGKPVPAGESNAPAAEPANEKPPADGEKP